MLRGARCHHRLQLLTRVSITGPQQRSTLQLPLERSNTRCRLPASPAATSALLPHSHGVSRRTPASWSPGCSRVPASTCRTVRRRAAEPSRRRAGTSSRASTFQLDSTPPTSAALKLCLAAPVARAPALAAVLPARAPWAGGAAALGAQALAPDSGKLVTPLAPAAAPAPAPALPMGPERALSVAAQPWAAEAAAAGGLQQAIPGCGIPRAAGAPAWSAAPALVVTSPSTGCMHTCGKMLAQPLKVLRAARYATEVPLRPPLWGGGCRSDKAVRTTGAVALFSTNGCASKARRCQGCKYNLFRTSWTLMRLAAGNQSQLQCHKARCGTLAAAHAYR